MQMRYLINPSVFFKKEIFFFLKESVILGKIMLQCHNVIYELLDKLYSFKFEFNQAQATDAFTIVGL